MAKKATKFSTIMLKPTDAQRIRMEESPAVRIGIPVSRIASRGLDLALDEMEARFGREASKPEKKASEKKKPKHPVTNTTQMPEPTVEQPIEQ